MSDVKYRSDKQLHADVAFNRKRMNDHKLRAEAAENVLAHRADMKEKLRTGSIKLYPYQQAAVDAILAGGAYSLGRGQGRTVVMMAVELAREAKDES